MKTEAFSFVTSRGNKVTVFNVKEVSHNGMFAGFGRTVETFAMVNDSHRVEVETGCAFTARFHVTGAGF